MEYKYILDKKKNKKYHCPKCNKPKVFTRYISKDTGKEAGENFGVCSRINECRHTNYPNGIDWAVKELKRLKPIKREPLKYLDKSWYRQQLYRDSDNNTFVYHLYKLLGVKNTENIIKDYKLGTGEDGAVIYPYFDHNNNLVAYKKMQYNVNGKRVKNKAYFNSEQNKYPIPLYGSHLINVYTNKPIAIAEGEKTTCYMRAYDNSYLWLATGGATMLNAAKIKPIKNRTIYLYPDVGMYEEWYKKMMEIKQIYKCVDISISKKCELLYNENKLKMGDDIGDYFSKNYCFNHSEQKLSGTIM